MWKNGENNKENKEICLQSNKSKRKKDNNYI